MFVIKLPYGLYLLNGLRDTKNIDEAKQFETKRKARIYIERQCPKGCELEEIK